VGGEGRHGVSRPKAEKPYSIAQVVVTQTPRQGVLSLTVWGDASLFTDSSDQKATKLTALQLKYLYR